MGGDEPTPALSGTRLHKHINSDVKERNSLVLSHVIGNLYKLEPEASGVTMWLGQQLN